MASRRSSSGTSTRPSHAHFGAGVARLEREWREWLAKFPLDPAHEKHVMRKLGRDLEGDARGVGEGEGDGALRREVARGLEPEERARWSVKDGVLIGTTTSRGRTSRRRRASARGSACGEAEARERERREAPRERRQGGDLSPPGRSYATAGAGFVGNEQVKIPVGQWVDLVVVDEGGRARVYLDGRGVFDAPGLWGDATGGSLAIGVERGVVEIKEWVVFEP